MVRVELPTEVPTVAAPSKEVKAFPLFDQVKIDLFLSWIALTDKKYALSFRSPGAYEWWEFKAMLLKMYGKIKHKLAYNYGHKKHTSFLLLKELDKYKLQPAAVINMSNAKALELYDVIGEFLEASGITAYERERQVPSGFEGYE